MSLFCKKVDLPGSGLLKGATDNHSHLLYGVDDGSRSLEESLSILGFMEEQGVVELWMTPHIMEDVPNRTEDLKARFERFRTQEYQGPIRLHLAAEYMLDNLYEERLAAEDLLYHGEGHVLVETSTVAPGSVRFSPIRSAISICRLRTTPASIKWASFCNSTFLPFWASMARSPRSGLSIYWTRAGIR